MNTRNSEAFVCEEKLIPDELLKCLRDLVDRPYSVRHDIELRRVMQKLAFLLTINPGSSSLDMEAYFFFLHQPNMRACRTDVVLHACCTHTNMEYVRYKFGVYYILYTINDQLMFFMWNCKNRSCELCCLVACCPTSQMHVLKLNGSKWAMCPLDVDR